MLSEDSVPRKRLETKALVIGYAMSRLDAQYLSHRGDIQWQTAYAEASKTLLIPATSVKQLRDEFDPVHANSRKGRYQRPLRQSRERVLNELHDVSDAALMELVSRILKKEDAEVVEAIDSLAVVTNVAHNVAERLLTGRLAEEYFLANSLQIIGVQPIDIIDCRLSAQGYDFGIKGRPELAVEVKGLKQMQGGIQMTDREWREAGMRKDNYWLTVIGNLTATPASQVFRNPQTSLHARCSYQQTLSVSWNARVTLHTSGV
jgi:hypothetical protein